MLSTSVSPARPTPDPDLTGIGLVLAAAISFGFLPVFSSSLSAAHVGVWVQVATRVGLSSLSFALIMRLLRTGTGFFLDRRDLPHAVANGALQTVNFGTYILAIASSTPNKVVLIAYFYPLWVVLFGALLLGERLNLRKIVAVILGFAGIAITVEVWNLFSPYSLAGARILSGDVWRNGAFRLEIGDLLAFANSLFTAMIVLYARWWRSRSHLPAVKLTMWSFGFSFGWILVLAGLDVLLNGGAGLAVQFHFDAGTPSLLPNLIGMAALGTAIPYLFFYVGIARVPSGVASIIMLPEVVAVFVLSAIFLGQAVSGAQLVGGAIILLAGVIIVR